MIDKKIILFIFSFLRVYAFEMNIIIIHSNNGDKKFIKNTSFFNEIISKKVAKTNIFLKLFEKNVVRYVKRVVRYKLSILT